MKPTTSALIAAKKREFLETNNMKGRQMYDHVQDDFKNVSCPSTIKLQSNDSIYFNIILTIFT